MFLTSPFIDQALALKVPSVRTRCLFHRSNFLLICYSANPPRTRKCRLFLSIGKTYTIPLISRRTKEK
jgi:hypothetical protein